MNIAEELAEHGVDTLAPYIVPALQKYLASEAGQARVGQLADELVKWLIAKLIAAQT